jgi:hypothetical protein
VTRAGLNLKRKPGGRANQKGLASETRTPSSGMYATERYGLSSTRALSGIQRRLISLPDRINQERERFAYRRLACFDSVKVLAGDAEARGERRLREP